MRFEARDLDPYPETVSLEELKQNEVYFSLQFTDGSLLYPRLEPLVFVGRNLEPGDVGFLYFQDIDSYREGVRYGSKNGEAVFCRIPENEIDYIYDYEHALNELMNCSLRRRKLPHMP